MDVVVPILVWIAVSSVAEGFSLPMTRFRGTQESIHFHERRDEAGELLPVQDDRGHFDVFLTPV